MVLPNPPQLRSPSNAPFNEEASASINFSTAPAPSPTLKIYFRFHNPTSQKNAIFSPKNDLLYLNQLVVVVSHSLFLFCFSLSLSLSFLLFFFSSFLLYHHVNDQDFIERMGHDGEEGDAQVDVRAQGEARAEDDPGQHREAPAA